MPFELKSPQNYFKYFYLIFQSETVVIKNSFSNGLSNKSSTCHRSQTVRAGNLPFKHTVTICWDIQNIIDYKTA